MSEDPSRQARRIAFSARANARGACGLFAVYLEDISLTGVRFRIARSEMHLDPDADLGEAAACVQTRLGSRFALDLSLTAGGRGRVRKNVTLVRLIIQGTAAEWVDIGCVFDDPITRTEAKALNLTLPSASNGPRRAIRHTEDWETGGRTSLDPALAEEKIESLFGVEGPARLAENERAPERPLRVLVRPPAGTSVTPLLADVDIMTDATVRIRVPTEALSRWDAGPADLSPIARGMLDDFGEWPTVEVVDGGRRVWFGPAHLFGLETGPALDGALYMRLAFNRRLQPSELDRICAA